jgi:hypothetical protein
MDMNKEHNKWNGDLFIEIINPIPLVLALTMWLQFRENKVIKKLMANWDAGP